MTGWVQDWSYVEAGLWAAVGTVFSIKAALPRETERGTCAIFAVAFFIFGGSDVVEAHTGAWWQPWWLAVWKGACLLVIVWGFRRLYAGRQR
ncbi:MAG: hypothetical protein ABI680_05325 [Chthoniobacteraceae bacterium]